MKRKYEKRSKVKRNYEERRYEERMKEKRLSLINKSARPRHEELSYEDF